MGDADLKDWIRKHRVCFEVSPHFEVHRREKLQVGFELALFARPSRSDLADAGGSECRQLFEGLREVLALAMPPGVAYTVQPFDASLRLRASAWEPEVQLVAEIIHGSIFAPVDEEERRYAREVRDALLRLGAREGTWPQPGSSESARAGPPD